MTGDESYHAECFRCRLCQKRIEDLVFAKTSQGIYCMVCHNERISKSKRSRTAGSRVSSVAPQHVRDKELPRAPVNNAQRNGAAHAELAPAFNSIAAEAATSAATPIRLSGESASGRRLSLRERLRPSPIEIAPLSTAASAAASEPSSAMSFESFVPILAPPVDSGDAELENALEPGTPPTPPRSVEHLRLQASEGFAPDIEPRAEESLGPPPNRPAPQTPGPKPMAATAATQTPSAAATASQTPLAATTATQTPVRLRHQQSKSLESPFSQVIPSPGSFLDLDHVAQHETPGSLTLSPAGQHGSLHLERSGTISRLASKVLRHRKTSSGGPAPPGSAGATSILSSSRRNSHRLGSQDLTRDALEHELQAKTERIANLEQSVDMQKQNRELELQLDTRKQMLANLETRLTAARAETTSILQHRHRASDLSVSLVDWQARVVHDLDASLKVAKDRTTRELEKLFRQRDDLRRDCDLLANARDTLTNEVNDLDQRRTQLTGLNESVVRSIQDGMSSGAAPREISSDADRTPIQQQREFAPDRQLIARNIMEPSTEMVQNAPMLSRQASQRTSSPAPSDSIDDVVVQKKTIWGKSGVKKAFRWGKSDTNAGTSLPVSRSQERLNKTGGLFQPLKRTWQSQGALNSYLGSEETLEGSQDSRIATPGCTTVFGNSLVSQAAIENREVPDIVTSCIRALELGCLEFEGLYRKSGGTGAMRLLVDGFESGQMPDAERLMADPAATSSVLKQYLRKLAQPLIPYSFYEPVVLTAGIQDEHHRLAALRDLLEGFPSAHRQTLLAVLRHMLRVTQFSGRNLMTPRNLAVVLAPSIIWDQTGAREIEDMAAKTLIVQFLIERADRL
ncbi:Rho-type gtpase-activating protein [Savitreella phatthalungensis]